MKRSLLTLALGAIFLGTFAQKGPMISIDTESIDYGTIAQGAEPNRQFTVTNTGDAPLIMSGCQGSCGCTVPTWPKEPIPPGGTGEIKVEFNSKGKPGRQTKRVTVTANTNPTETFLEITGDVKGKEQPTAKGE